MCPPGTDETSQVPYKGLFHMHEVYDCARSDAILAVNVWHDFAFSSTEGDQHLEVRPISQLDTQPMASPVNASRLNSRVTAHHSGPRQLAKPYLVEDFHLLSFASLSWRTPFWADNRLLVIANIRVS